jgi:hypothetical protein
LQSRTALPVKRQDHLTPAGGENKSTRASEPPAKIRSFAARVSQQRTSRAPALDARYFILRILSSALVSIVFNKLGNLLLVQKLTPMASTSLVNARLEHGSAPAHSRF